MDELTGGPIAGNSLPPSGYYDQQERMKLAGVPTMAQRLDLVVAQAEERLAAAKRAREILKANPDLEELLNIMQRSHF